MKIIRYATRFSEKNGITESEDKDAVDVAGKLGELSVKDTKEETTNDKQDIKESDKSSSSESKTETTTGQVER